MERGSRGGASVRVLLNRNRGSEQIIFYSLQNLRQFVQYFVIGKAEHPVVQLMENTGAAHIIFGLGWFVMDFTINLYYQIIGQAYKVHNEGIDGVLPPKFCAELLPAQFGPQYLFGFRWSFAHGAAELFSMLPVFGAGSENVVLHRASRFVQQRTPRTSWPLPARLPISRRILLHHEPIYLIITLFT